MLQLPASARFTKDLWTDTALHTLLAMLKKEGYLPPRGTHFADLFDAQ